MGIYVGRLPSHASNVALILNPRMGHVSPQFHVVYDDDFTTVSYLRTAAVPPDWAELVCASSTIALYTEHEVGTWQSIPELDVDLGDFTSDTATIMFSDQEQDNEIQRNSPDSSITQPDEW